MPGREYRQTARHRFQHRVGNAFLVAVAAHFTWVDKNVRLIIELAQLRLRNEPGKEDLVRDAEIGRELSELRPQRAFAGNREGRLGISLREFGKRAQPYSQSLFLDEPAGLDEFPGAVLRPDPRLKWNLAHRN